MKKLILSMALVGASFSVHANNWNMPWNNNNGFNNGSSWNMPNFNWGNNNNRSGFNNGSSWSMPNFNWGNNNGYGSGSNWSMPNFNWGNGFNNGYNNGSNWSMPSFNWNNNNQPWGYGGNRYYNNGTVPSYSYAPRIPNQQYRAPQRPAAPSFAPRNVPQNTQGVPTPRPMQKPMPKPTPGTMPSQHMAMPKMPQNTAVEGTNKGKVAPTLSKTMPKMPTAGHIPMPQEVKGVILAPENKPAKADTTKN